MIDNYAAFLNCTPVGRASLCDGHDLKLFILVGAGASCLLLSPPGFNWCFSFVPELFGGQGCPSSGGLLNL